VIVRIRRLGGLAGFDEELGVLDTARLGPGGAERVRAQLAEIERLTAVDERLGADQLHFEIAVEGDERGPRVLVAVDEGDPQDPLMKHVEGLLGELATSGPGGGG
jgi:hypothetical protein